MADTIHVPGQRTTDEELAEAGDVGGIGLPDVEAGARPTSRSGRRAQVEANRAARQAKADAAEARRRAREARPKITPPRKGNVADSVNGLHQLAGGLGLPLAGLPATGAALVAAGPDAGKAWAALATRYPALERLFTGGGDGVLFVALLMAYLPVVTTAAAEAKTPRGERAAAPVDLSSLLGLAVPETPAAAEPDAQDAPAPAPAFA